MKNAEWMTEKGLKVPTPGGLRAILRHGSNSFVIRIDRDSSPPYGGFGMANKLDIPGYATHAAPPQPKPVLSMSEVRSKRSLIGFYQLVIGMGVANGIETTQNQ